MYVTPSVVQIHLDLYMHMELIYRRKCANSLSPVKDKQAIRYFSLKIVLKLLLILTLCRRFFVRRRTRHPYRVDVTDLFSLWPGSKNHILQFGGSWKQALVIIDLLKCECAAQTVWGVSRNLVSDGCFKDKHLFYVYTWGRVVFQLIRHPALRPP